MDDKTLRTALLVAAAQPSLEEYPTSLRSTSSAETCWTVKYRVTAHMIPSRTSVLLAQSSVKRHNEKTQFVNQLNLRYEALLSLSWVSPHNVSGRLSSTPSMKPVTGVRTRAAFSCRIVAVSFVLQEGCTFFGF